MMSCSLCGGVLALLGCLGKLAWFRCIQCGMQCSHDAAVLDTEDD